MQILFLLLVIGSPAFSADSIQYGTFSLATEAGWGSAFELKKDGTAIITPSHDTESEDGKASAKVETVQGRWKTTNGGIEISYSKYVDQFKFEKECRDWNEHPCFRFQKSNGSGKSPLNFDYAYINWDWKNPRAAKVPSKKCKEECAQMLRDGILKKDMDLNSCVEKMCK